LKILKNIIQVFQNTPNDEGNINVQFLSLANVGTCVAIQALELLNSLKQYMKEGGISKTIEELTIFLDGLRKVGFAEKQGKENVTTRTIQTDRLSDWKLYKLYTNRIYSADENPEEIPLNLLYIKPSLLFQITKSLFEDIHDFYKDKRDKGRPTKIHTTRLELIDYLSKKNIKKLLLIDSSCGQSKYENRRDEKQIVQYSKDHMIAGKRKSRRKSKRK
jgi:hypothetical protein